MNNEHKKIEEFYKKILADYLEQYMREDTPEEERIISYDLRGYVISDGEEEVFETRLSFGVEPYSKENTKWTYPKGELCTNISAFDFCCFVKYKKVNDNYELERISEYPENYDEFLARFEEYKANLPEETSVTENVQAIGSTENYLASQEIKTISNEILIGSGILLVLAVLIVFSMIRKRK